MDSYRTQQQLPSPPLFSPTSVSTAAAANAARRATATLEAAREENRSLAAQIAALEAAQERAWKSEALQAGNEIVTAAPTAATPAAPTAAYLYPPAIKSFLARFPPAAPTAAPSPPARSYNAVPPPASYVTAAATTCGFPSMGKWSHLDHSAAASLPYSSSATEAELLWNKVFVDAQRRFIHLHQRAAVTAEARGRGGRGSGGRDRRDRRDREYHNRPYNFYFK
ncbi:uncharacterized protein LOC143220220 [Lasioglossum baleicum]|uniref:uncharacterized protein LOC143220220 n=1 Tax=Lasioglossum baleicum TaxID=434251 RepID=UPI003FCE6EC9